MGIVRFEAEKRTMRNIAEERSGHTRHVDHTGAKVEAMERFLANSRSDDPIRPETERLLCQMRHNASDAKLNRGLFQMEQDQATLQDGARP